MQRDMTPREIHKADLDRHFSADKIDCTSGDNKHVILYDPNHPVCKKYPNLTFLLGWHKIKHLRTEIIETYERYLTYVINADDNNMKPELNDDPNIEVTRKWYLGLLDPNFHYRSTNDQRFVEHMQTQTQLIGKENEL